VVVVKYSPKIVFSSLGQSPAPRFLNFNRWTVHLRDIEAIGESRELGILAKCVLAKLCSSQVAVDLQSRDWVSQGDDSASPTLVERLVSISVRGGKRRGILEGGGGVEGVVRAVEFHVIDDTGEWEFDCTGDISLVGVAAIAGHPADVAVFLLGPDCGLESEAFLGGEGLLVVGVVLLDAEGCS